MKKSNEVKQKEITLSDGSKAVIGQFKGYHIAQARKLTDDPNQLISAIISLVVNIDGKPILMEDLDQMDGFDVLALMAEFSAFIPASAK